MQFRTEKWGLTSLAAFGNLTRKSFAFFTLHFHLHHLHFHSDSFRIWLQGIFKHVIHAPFHYEDQSQSTVCQDKGAHVCLRDLKCMKIAIPGWLQQETFAFCLHYLTTYYLTGTFAISAVSYLFQVEVRLRD